MDPAVDGQFRVQHAALDAELLQVQLHPVAAVHVTDENDALALDQFEFEEGEEQEELLVLTAVDDVLRHRAGGLVFFVLKIYNGWIAAEEALERFGFWCERCAREEGLKIGREKLDKLGEVLVVAIGHDEICLVNDKVKQSLRR